LERANSGLAAEAQLADVQACIAKAGGAAVRGSSTAGLQALQSLEGLVAAVRFAMSGTADPIVLYQRLHAAVGAAEHVLGGASAEQGQPEARQEDEEMGVATAMPAESGEAAGQAEGRASPATSQPPASERRAKAAQRARAGHQQARTPGGGRRERSWTQPPQGQADPRAMAGAAGAVQLAPSDDDPSSGEPDPAGGQGARA